MHRSEQLKHWIRSLAAKMWQQIRFLMVKVASLREKTKSWHAHDLIPTLGTLMGAVAFGLWQQSFAAALFAGIGLFFLAGIFNNTERMLTALRHSEGDPHFGNVDARDLAEPTMQNSGALNQAIGSLKPWLANEVSLTEEDAKECCAVLLDSVAARARPTANKFLATAH